MGRTDPELYSEGMDEQVEIDLKLDGPKEIAAKIYQTYGKRGRPSRDELDMRQYLEEFEQYRAMRTSGALDEFLHAIGRNSRGLDISDDPKSKKKSKGIFSGLDLKELFLDQDSPYITTILNQLGSATPIVAGLISLYIAEEKLVYPEGEKKGEKILPPLLHTVTALLPQILLTLKAMMIFFEKTADFTTSSIIGVTDVFDESGKPDPIKILRKAVFGIWDEAIKGIGF